LNKKGTPVTANILYIWRTTGVSGRSDPISRSYVYASVTGSKCLVPSLMIQEPNRGLFV